MAEGVSHVRQYWVIFVVLAVLTAVEVWAAETGLFTKFQKGSVLTALALVKAGLVAWYYMHLNEERGWLRFIALIPVAAFAYAFVVTLESLYR